MARQRMVTRTVKGNEVSITVVDKESKQVTNEVITVGEVKTEKELIKAVTKAIGEGKVLITINERKEIEKRYGMLETDFIANARVLDKDEVEESEVEA